MTLHQLRQEADAFTISQLLHFPTGTKIGEKYYRAVWPKEQLEQYIKGKAETLPVGNLTLLSQFIIDYISTHESFGTNAEGAILNQMPRCPVVDGVVQWDMALLEEVISTTGGGWITVAEAEALANRGTDADI